MKSKVAKKIISETSEETKQKAKDYANRLIMLFHECKECNIRCNCTTAECSCSCRTEI